MNPKSPIHTLLDTKDWTLHRVIEEKTTQVTSSVHGARVNPQSCKNEYIFFLGPWLLVCQLIEISNQMGPTGEASNIEQINLFNASLYKKISFGVYTTPVGSI